MAYKIVSHRLEAHPSPSPEDLRRKFESAVCELHPDLAAQKHLRYRSPIVSRRKILGLSQVDAEKRAVSDAARALAELWKVQA
jgi:hypothetical protein